MSPIAYYNEFDPKAAAWLRELIRAGEIAYGVVDERDIRDIRPSELAEFTQCHFFAGIGVWSYALRLAGWPDDQPVWTGSCPCQPFSAAGRGKGFNDERHVWPAWYNLVDQLRPAVIFGEQVASKDADPWIDLVQDDVEAVGYAFGAVPFPAAGVGAPNIRDRLYWVACADSERRAKHALLRQRSENNPEAAGSGEAGWLGNTGGGRSGRDAGAFSRAERSAERGVRGVADLLKLTSADVRLADSDCTRLEVLGEQFTREKLEALERGCPISGLADADGGHAGTERQQRSGEQRSGEQRQQPQDGSACPIGAGVPGPTNGRWRAADWILCRDPDVPKWRPVEPGSFPLAHGAAARVGRLRGYGNAINAEAARAFIEAYQDFARLNNLASA